MATDWHAHWQKLTQVRGPGACLLWPLSRLYGALLGLRRLAYRLGCLRALRLPVPVLVVGNVVAGGAGKTPTVVALVQALRALGWQPGVVSRGHGRQGNEVRAVTADSQGSDVGDEPLLIHQRTGVPVVVGRDRHAAGRRLLQQHPEVDLLISDDGLQHWRLHRDLAVVVFDERGLGNGWLLPAGLLREPWPVPGVHAPQFVLLQHRAGHSPPEVPTPPGVSRHSGERRLGDTRDADGRERPLRHWAQQPVHALAGIARPAVFFEMLRTQGLTLGRTLALPDHADTQTLLHALSSLDGPVLCTDKDAVKLWPALSGAQRLRVWAVGLELALDPALVMAIDHRLRARRPL